MRYHQMELLTVVGGSPRLLTGPLGGALGETICLRATVVVAVASELIALPGLLFSPVRSLREIEAVSRNMQATRSAVFRYKFGAPTQ